MPPPDLRTRSSLTRALALAALVLSLGPPADATADPPVVRRAAHFSWPTPLRDLVHGETCDSVEESWTTCGTQFEVLRVDLDGDRRDELLILARAEPLLGFSGAFPILVYSERGARGWTRLLAAHGQAVSVDAVQTAGFADLVVRQREQGCVLETRYAWQGERYTRRASVERCD